MSKKKLLLTGASGFLGYHLLRVAGDWEVYGIAFSKPVQYANSITLVSDLTNYIELGNLFDDISPDAVIHTAAVSNANFCEQNKEWSYALNVEATKNIVGICSDFQIPFVFTSTDLVFDGKKGMYCESDEKNPLNTYGEQKALAEDKVLSIYPAATVLRLPLMFGEPRASTANYLQKFIGELQNNQPVPLFSDEYRSIAGARSIAQGIFTLMKHSGTIHIAGNEKLSRYSFGIKAAEVLGLNTALIHACSQKDVKMAAPRPADVSLDISKAISLGYKPATIAEELNLIATQKYF